MLAPTAGSPATTDRTERSRRWMLGLGWYWLGLAILWGCLSSILLPALVAQQVPDAVKTTALAAVAVAQAIVSIIVQPLAGTASDRVGTRWGRRRPWMALAVTAQVIFVAILASAGSYLAIILTMIAVEICSNLAQGPYQGLLPDLVARSQRGLASGIMGGLQMLGQIVGAAIAGVLVANGELGAAAIMAAIAVWIGMAGTVVTVREPSSAAPAGSSADDLPATRDHGRRISLREVIRGAWGRDLLEERDFLWLLASRLAILMAAGSLQPFILYYLQDTLGMGSAAGEAVAPIAAVVAVVAVIAAVPGGALTERFGRVPVVALSGVLGMVAALLFAMAPGYEALFLVGACFGAALGIFMSADWALLADTAPEGQAGRYFGLSNTVTALASLLAVVIAGPLADLANGVEAGLGYRVVFVIAAVEFAAGAWLVRRVRDRRPGDPIETEPAPMVTGAVA